VLGIFRNHLRLAATEAALRESAAVCHVIETRVPIGVFQTDCSGRLIRTNRRWRLIANLNHVSEPHGVWSQMVHPADRERVLAGWRATQQHGHDFRSEFRVHAGAGAERYARTTIVQNYAADGSRAFFLGVSEDITERHRFEAELKEAHDELEDRVKLRTAQLEKANRELAQFAHVVAHDLKAPLRAVTNIAEWLWRDYEEKLGAAGYRFLSLLKQRARHMHDLIEGILAYTRFGPLAEAEVDVDLHELITQIIALLAPPPDMIIRLPEVLPHVPGVAERLRHIFQNLLDNAVKFMDKPRGVITLTATRLARRLGVRCLRQRPGHPRPLPRSRVQDVRAASLDAGIQPAPGSASPWSSALSNRATARSDWTPRRAPEPRSRSPGQTPRPCRRPPHWKPFPFPRSDGASPLPDALRSEPELDAWLTRPGPELVRFIRNVASPLVILGAGGKMGPTLAVLARRAADEAGHPLEIIAISRFGNDTARRWLTEHGVQTLSRDLLDADDVRNLPEAENLLYLVGLKFGTAQNPALTWAVNTLVPAQVLARYPHSRVVALSTGNVYPLSPVVAGGSLETDSLTPLGEYANAAVARERIFSTPRAGMAPGLCCFDCSTRSSCGMA
jgi:PAS domain S-box-containing protein